MKDIDKIVLLINDKLKNSSMSLNQVLKNLGYKNINRIKTEIENAGYKYIYENRQYTKVSQEDKAKNVVVQDNNIQMSHNDIDINDLKELLSLKDDLKELIQQYHNSKNIIDVEPVELKIKPAPEIKQRLFKVDVEVLKNWDKFIAEHREFKVQDIISQALSEFVEKYSN